MEGLTFRRATPEDTERIAEIMFGNPPRDVVGMLLDEERARQIGKELVRQPNSPQGWQRTVLAELGGEAVGVLQGSVEHPGVRLSAGLALAALRIYGPVDLVRMVRRLRARRRVDIEEPSGAYGISELHVDPAYRSRGIGGTLLSYAEGQARQVECRVMSLTTHMANPARHLYERHGYRVVETRRDPAYERYTGIEGRLLMVKELR
jgi:ribosomal protein S18 acetylase RimI-like enzyme